MPARKKPFKYAVQTTKRKKGKKKPEGYKPPPSPKDRCTPWVSVTVRAEHYAMLREIGDFYEAPVSKVVATLIVYSTKVNSLTLNLPIEVEFERLPEEDGFPEQIDITSVGLKVRGKNKRRRKVELLFTLSESEILQLEDEIDDF